MCLTQFLATSDKRQATSDKRQATSDKRQATKRHKLRTQTNSQLNTHFLTVHRTHKSESPSLCVFYITPFNKPQRPQSVELHSSPQRIIKDVLTKTPLKPPRMAVVKTFRVLLTQNSKIKNVHGRTFLIAQRLN